MMRKEIATKKILIIINKLSRAGAEKQLLLILRNLKDKYQFQIISLYGKGEFELPFTELGIPVFHWHLNGSLIKPANIYQIFMLLKHTLKYRPNIIHSWLFHSNMISTVLKSASRSCGFIASVRGSNFWHKKIHMIISNIIYRTCDCIITNSPGLKAEIQANYASEDKIELIYNGVEGLTKEQRENGIDLFESEKAEGKIIIGCVGRFVKEKRYCDVIEIAMKLTEQYSNILFVLVGGRGEYESYKKEIENSPLKNHVILAGEVDNPLAYIKSFDIYLMTSSHEGMPNSLMEAMSMGKAVVATAVGAIPDLVTTGINGILVPVADPAKTSNALGKLIENRALAREFGKNNIEKMQEFSIEKMVSRYEEIYDRVITDYP
ncbi:hypothetical protein MNBD_GAMMA15-1146 [hydrothermal vent metagenome]|uniref:Glycosyltransferase n=1 Tax=hydrothermal vent metagenome TaxID=652676 RepID=A0A3B0YGP8_9ZZZZ